jgi:hypothetical protein
VENPYARVRAAVGELLQLMGASGDVPIKAIDVHIEGVPTPIPIHFFTAPPLKPDERVVIDAIRRAGEPLQQAEIAKATSMALRVIQKLTPVMCREGKLLRHPSLGFYCPGMDVSDAE